VLSFRVLGASQQPGRRPLQSSTHANTNTCLEQRRQAPLLAAPRWRPAPLGADDGRVWQRRPGPGRFGLGSTARAGKRRRFSAWQQTRPRRTRDGVHHGCSALPPLCHRYLMCSRQDRTAARGASQPAQAGAGARGSGSAKIEHRVSSHLVLSRRGYRSVPFPHAVGAA